MGKTQAGPVKDRQHEFATFAVGKTLLGINILSIQEINKQSGITHVPQSPDYIKGVLNLRGRIVTIIDLRSMLGLGRVERKQHCRNVIVRSDDEHIGLLVESVGDVIPANQEDIEQTPTNMGESGKKYFKGVLKTGNLLVGILDVERVLTV